MVVDKADRSCREGWWRASSNRVGNEERQRRRRQQRRHPLYLHTHAHTCIRIARTNAHRVCPNAQTHTCERARVLFLSLSFCLFLGLFILLFALAIFLSLSLAVSNHISLYVTLSLSLSFSPIPLLSHLQRRPRVSLSLLVLLSVTMLPRWVRGGIVAGCGFARQAGTYYAACAARYALRGPVAVAVAASLSFDSRRAPNSIHPVGRINAPLPPLPPSFSFTRRSHQSQSRVA